MIVFPRTFRPRSAQRRPLIVRVAAPPDVRDLRLTTRMPPRAVWTIDKASGRLVCLWDRTVEELGRGEGEGEEAQRRLRRLAWPRALIARGLRFREASIVIKTSRR